MGIVAWLIVGAVGGYLGGLVVKGEERMGTIGHVLLGIVGAIAGGLIAGFVTGGDVIAEIDVTTVVVAAVGAVATVTIWKAMPRNTSSGGRVA